MGLPSARLEKNPILHQRPRTPPRGPPPLDGDPAVRLPTFFLRLAVVDGRESPSDLFFGGGEGGLFGLPNRCTSLIRAHDRRTAALRVNANW